MQLNELLLLELNHFRVLFDVVLKRKYEVDIKRFQLDTKREKCGREAAALGREY